MPVQESSRPEPPGLPGERGWLPRDTGCQTQTGKALDPWGHGLPRLSGPLSLPLYPLLPAELTVSVPDVASVSLSVH